MHLYQKILSKQMTRKEFLGCVGLLFLTILGISALLKNISALNPTKSKATQKIAKTPFGSGPYGI